MPLTDITEKAMAERSEIESVPTISGNVFYNLKFTEKNSRFILNPVDNFGKLLDNVFVSADTTEWQGVLSLPTISPDRKAPRYANLKNRLGLEIKITNVKGKSLVVICGGQDTIGSQGNKIELAERSCAVFTPMALGIWGVSITK